MEFFREIKKKHALQLPHKEKYHSLGNSYDDFREFFMKLKNNICDIPYRVENKVRIL